MFRIYVIRIEWRTIFKPYILSSSKETTLTFEYKLPIRKSLAEFAT